MTLAHRDDDSIWSRDLVFQIRQLNTFTTNQFSTEICDKIINLGARLALETERHGSRRQNVLQTTYTWVHTRAEICCNDTRRHGIMQRRKEWMNPNNQSSGIKVIWKSTGVGFRGAILNSWMTNSDIPLAWLHDEFGNKLALYKVYDHWGMWQKEDLFLSWNICLHFLNFCVKSSGRLRNLLIWWWVVHMSQLIN